MNEKIMEAETSAEYLQSGVSVDVNPPFRGVKFIANRKLDAGDVEKLEKTIPQQERLQFVITGDLSIKNRYANTFLAVTDRGLYAFDQELPDGVAREIYANIDSAKVKRYYGNAMLVLKPTEEGKKRVHFLRFSYTQANLFDAAAGYISAVASGADMAEELVAVKAALEKQFCVCPKCGRTLLRPGAPCMKCESKDAVVKKLGKYILPYKGILIFCMFLSVITTAASLAPPYMTRQLVDDVLPGKDIKGLITCVLILLSTHLIRHGIGTIRGYYLKNAGNKIVTDMRNDVYRKAQLLPMRFYDSTSTGSMINRISGDSNTIQAFMLRVTQEVLVQLFQLVGIVIIMFTMSWQLTLLSLVPVPFVVVGSRLFRKKMKPIYRRIWRMWAAVTSVLTDTIPGIRVVKAFANEEEGMKKFSARNAAWLETHKRASLITNIYPHAVNFLMSCGSLLIWAVGGQLVIKGSDMVSAGLLVSFISYTSMFYTPVNFFANFNDSYQQFLNSAERLMDIMDAEPEHNFAVGKHPEKIVGKIEFKNVNFSFERAKKTLTDVNFVIEPGDVVGIVGTTGAGKSTIINLLMRYYDHYDGQILIDDIDIRDIDMTFYRSQIGYVQQEPMMFNDSIYQNISFGSPNATVEDVLHAADVANAHNFISRLPDGYDTVLGERGTGLSGGERQRLSIARAVLREPSILFFDEATASVDSETEHLIQESIEKLIAGRTTLMVAHRLSTLRRANKIIVVDRGKILEMGTPQELMEKKGKYYKLVQIQTMSEEIKKAKEEERFD